MVSKGLLHILCHVKETPSCHDLIYFFMACNGDSFITYVYKSFYLNKVIKFSVSS